VEAAAITKRFRPKPRGMSGSIFKRTAHLRAFVTDDEPTPEKRRRSAIRMPRTVVTAPSAGPSRETPARRSRSRPAPAAADAPQASTRRRRPSTKTTGSAATVAEPAIDTAAESAPVDATEEPAIDTGEGDTQ